MTRKMMWMAVFALGGCLGPAPQNPAPVGSDTQPGVADPAGGAGGEPTLGVAPPTASGDLENTFDHESNQVDPFAVLSRIQEQGAPEVSTRMHSCQKLKYATLGRVLTGLGVDLARTATPPSAGQLYRGGAGALGSPNYAARIAEAVELTTAGATKLFDIMVRAAPEVIMNMPNVERCKVGGVGTQMFDANGRCTMEGIACLTGAPATQQQKDLCDQVLTSATSADKGQVIAVATILAAAHTCE